MKELEILDEGQPGDQGDGDTGAGDELGSRATIWLHRTDEGHRVVWVDVHPAIRPTDCEKCRLFIEADSRGRP